MPTFRTPKLDDRSYEDLRRELVRRIPVHSQEWTDHNAGDPGIALLEVFAWLSENLLHRLNRVPEKAQLEFLNLLDVPLRPARPARAMVRLELLGKPDEPQLLPSGPTAEKTVVLAGKVEFQVKDEIEVLPVEALVAVKEPGPDAADPDLVGVGEVRQALEDHLGDKDALDALETYKTRILEPPRDGILPAPTAIGATIDKVLWIALLVPAALAKAPDPADLRAKAQELRKKLAGRVLSIGVRMDATLCGPADVERCPDPGAAEQTLPVVWQVASGRFVGSQPRLDRLRYERLAVEGDGTAGLTTSGVWRLRLPAEASAFGTWDEGSGLDAALLGAGDLPPLLDDEKQAARVITWIRCFRPRRATSSESSASAPMESSGPRPCGSGGGGGSTADAPASLPQPVVRWVDVNLVEVEQAVTAQPEILGNGTGRPAQTVRLSRAPVLEDSLFLEIREPGGWVPWRRVDTFADADPGDPVYMLDPVSGEILFGDGIRGRMPRAGELIRARTYRYGGGVAGNVPAGALNKIRLPRGVEQLGVTNPLPAEGGIDGETVEQGKARIPAVLRHNGRAVAAEDFRDLALETPGAGLGRVEVLPRHKPQERVDGVPGVVTLIVIPAYDPLHPDEPVPDREVLRRVCAWLEPRRLVTTELYVTAPEYVPIWVSVAFEVESGYGAQTVRRWVELAIRQHLAPLPPYGPAGQGWPFGRAVTGPDIEAAVLRVEGVRLVKGVIVEGDSPQDGEGQRVELRSWQLPVVRNVQLNTTGDEPDPIDRDGDSARSDGGTAIPVPVIEEVC